MDLGTAIIGAILLAICIVPIVLMGQKRKKRERKTLQSLINIANQQNCSISKHELCGDFVIGIDETKKFVFFFKQLEDTIVEQSINLAEIQKCSIKNTTRRVSSDTNSQSVIEKLELNFIPFGKNRSEISLEFYNTTINTQLGGELQALERWSKHINANLKK